MHGFPIRFNTTANAVRLKPLSHMSIMAGASGFEPLVSRVRVCCLTTWRSPYKLAGTKGFEPLQNDLESFVLAITPSSLKWQEHQDSNLKIMGSKPTALPFGYAPKIGANEENRTLTDYSGRF